MVDVYTSFYNKKINIMENKRIFITGGAGFLGKNIVKKYYDNNEIAIYSRDEAKHYFLKKRISKIKMYSWRY